MRTWNRREILTAGVAAAVATAGLRTARADENTPSVRVRGTAEQASEDPYVVVPADQPAAIVTVAPTAGEAIAQLGLAYVGSPYVAAGNSPAGFDCSGFTQYITLITLGVDIGHAVEGQPGAGPAVAWGAWLPGDLVFFQNTYRAGISHVGIYVGDGLFVHAQNEETGVVVTSIYGDYYASRYWGATRLA